MPINLQKSDQEVIHVPKFTIGIGWDVNVSGGYDFDLDASIFLLGDNKKLVSDEHFVFYNNLKTADGSIEHTGDNRTGAGEGDDEAIKVDLSKIDQRVKEISIVVTIYEGEERRQNFGQIDNSFIRIFDTITGNELLKYELEEDFPVETAVEFGRIYQHENVWRFEAVGIGMKGGLMQYLQKYN